MSVSQQPCNYACVIYHACATDDVPLPPHLCLVTLMQRSEHGGYQTIFPLNLALYVQGNGNEFKVIQPTNILSTQINLRSSKMNRTYKNISM